MKTTVIIIAALLLIGLISCTATDSSDDTSGQESSITAVSSDKSNKESSSKTSSAESSSKESSEDSSSIESSSKEEAKPSSSRYISSSSEDNSRTVYITPTGKRYHLDPDCGGKNSTATTLNKAEKLGLTPCAKCAQ